MAQRLRALTRVIPIPFGSNILPLDTNPASSTVSVNSQGAVFDDAKIICSASPEASFNLGDTVSFSFWIYVTELQAE